MPITLNTLEEWRARLLEAIASDVREVRDQNGESVSYRSTGELQSALDRVEAELRRFNSNPPNTILFRTSKGLT